MTNQEVADRVRALVDEVLVGTPHYLVEIEVRGSRGSQVVDIFVDSDRDIGLDELAHISREVGFLMDTEELMDSRYNLNVSSPGVDRPLKLPRQYKKNVGRQLQVHYQKADGSGNTEVTAELKRADEEAIEVAVSSSEVRRIPLGDILWAKVKLPW